MDSFFYDILGLQAGNAATGETASNHLDGAMKLVIDLRATARANRDFATSDKIRNDLAAAGIQLNDGPDGTSFTVQ
jgi:cysteinyl-tRNA synthetase